MPEAGGQRASEAATGALYFPGRRASGGMTAGEIESERDKERMR
jgi:hypothetical protein